MKKTKPKKLEKKKCPICEWQKPVKGNRIVQHEYAKSGLICGGSKRHVGPLFFFGKKLKGDPDAGGAVRAKVVRVFKHRSGLGYVSETRTWEGLGRTPEEALKRLENGLSAELKWLKKIVSKRR